MISLIRAFVISSILAIATVGAAVAQADAPPVPLAEAVRFAPPETSSVLFTDWASLKRLHGDEQLSSATPLDERMSAMLDLAQAEAPLAAFAINRFASHADSWGWDTTDLDWEASFSVDGPPVSVLRFREGFDLGAVMARFDEREFSSETYRDATIRSHEMDIGADWIRDSDFGVLNTAFLDDGRTLVLSSGVDGVKAALDAPFMDFVRAPPAWVVADALGEPLTAGIEIGLDGCTAYDPRMMPAGQAADEELLQDVGPLHAWEGMGAGSYRDGETPVGRFVFTYPTPDEAAADLDGRVRLAEEGTSLVSGEPYAASIFRVLDAAADGATITLEVELVGGPKALQMAFYTRDLVFATCG